MCHLQPLACGHQASIASEQVTDGVPWAKRAWAEMGGCSRVGLGSGKSLTLSGNMTLVAQKGFPLRNGLAMGLQRKMPGWEAEF
jgi:hypothetical protein